MSKRELLEALDDIESGMSSYTLSVEDAYAKLYNVATDYSYSLEDIFYDYMDYDQAEEMLRSEVETWGLARVYYFLGDVNPMACEVFRINWYGNLEEVHYNDIEDLIDEVRDAVGEDEDSD